MIFLKELRNYSNLTQEKLAKKLETETFNVSQYEIGRSMPSFKMLLKIMGIFELSLDYLLLENKCFYPRNIRLLELAKKLDQYSKSAARNNIESTTKTFFKEKINEDITLKSDILDLQLSNNFNTNLKQIRNHRDISQRKLGDQIGISGPLIAMYEKQNYPSTDKLISLSESLNISIHALATGNKLNFDFQDRHFGTTILLADHFLSLDNHKILITLMENIVTQPA